MKYNICTQGYRARRLFVRNIDTVSATLLTVLGATQSSLHVVVINVGVNLY